MGNIQVNKRSKSTSSSLKRSKTLIQNSTISNNILVARTKPFENDYFISNGIGEGMNGKVFLVTNILTKKKYALKILIDSKNSRREVELQWRSSRNCEHIVKIIDLYENKVDNKRCLFVVMEYMEGGELFDRLKRKKKFTEQEVAKIMRQICTAVNHLHTMGIAHRDLKPENLLLSSKDDNAIIKLSDFGFAKEANKGLITPNFTPYYVPPEILSFEKYDISCDIWSLGVIMYILCCGYPPFYSTHGQPISPGMKKRIKRGQYEFPPADWLDVSQEAKDLIIGMLETVPDNRLKISDIMRSKWILNFINVPKTRLNSIKVLNDQKENWKEYKKNMRKALEEMRVNDDKNLIIKNIDKVDNSLLKRRMNKKRQLTLVKIDELDKDKETEETNVIRKTNEIANNLNLKRLNRVQSMPESRTLLTAFYYTTDLKNLNNFNHHVNNNNNNNNNDADDDVFSYSCN